MGKHVNADATNDEDDAAAVDGAGVGTHNGPARHSAEGAEPVESQVDTIADAAAPDASAPDAE